MPIDPDDKDAVTSFQDALIQERQRGRNDRTIECAQLRAVVAALAKSLSWCVEYDGECLGDNYEEMREAKAALLAHANISAPATLCDDEGCERAGMPHVCV